MLQSVYASSKLADLNIIENFWGWMARKVYEGGRQFHNKESLKIAWEDISLNYITSLYTPLPSRICNLQFLYSEPILLSRKESVFFYMIPIINFSVCY